ncbi:hypothetical protein M9H77_30960 [Catharanthus roseus]|uniref:Uncharacterized protein n=1 Tax=Catharanthus roseus TaxID=4058 RepID=A0ACB9ZYP2_CATRO|nr:hypothetical protein M9H77_30960 [Catharanthus roseus]
MRQFARDQMVPDAVDTRLDLQRIQLRGNDNTYWGTHHAVHLDAWYQWRFRVRDGPTVAVEALSYPSDEYIRGYRGITRVCIGNPANRDTRAHRYQPAAVDRRMMTSMFKEVDDMASVVIREPPSSSSQIIVDALIRNTISSRRSLCSRRDAVPGSTYQTEVLVELRGVLEDILGWSRRWTPSSPPTPERHEHVDPGHVVVERGFALFQSPHSISYGFFGFRAPPPPGTSCYSSRCLVPVVTSNPANRDTHAHRYQPAGVDRRMMTSMLQEVDDMASLVIQEPPSSPSQMVVVMKKVQTIIRRCMVSISGTLGCIHSQHDIQQTFPVQPSRCRPWEHVPDRGARGVKRGARRHPGVEQEVDALFTSCSRKTQTCRPRPCSGLDGFLITSHWIRDVPVASRARFRICLVSITTFNILRASSSDEEEREEDIDGVHHFGFGHRVGKKTVQFTASDWP